MNLDSVYISIETTFGGLEVGATFDTSGSDEYENFKEEELSHYDDILDEDLYNELLDELSDDDY